MGIIPSSLKRDKDKKLWIGFSKETKAIFFKTFILI